MVSIPVSMYQTVVANISQLTDVQAHGIQVAMAPIAAETNSESQDNVTSSAENVNVLTAVTSSSAQVSEQS